MSSKRALLIGINDYPHLKSLRGCLNDVALMESILTERFGFTREKISQLCDSEATREGILVALNKLVDEAESNEIVVVYYAGHGSQMTDREGDEPDGLDETIVPHDSGREPNENRDITDDELYYIFLRLSKKTPHVTLIFDSCHSATITRDAFGVDSRSVPADKRPAEQLPASPITGMNALALPSNVGPSGWLPLGSRYVLLAGCRSDESSYEHRLFQDNELILHGAFTFFLGRQLLSAKPGTTYRDIFELASGHVTQNHPNQHPQIEGTLDRELFGTRDIEQMKFIAITKRSATSVTLAAGAAHGLMSGSTWNIYPKDVKAVTENTEELGQVKLTTVRAVTSEALIIAEPHSDAIVAGSRSVEHTHSYGQMQLRVEVVPDNEQLEIVDLKAAIEKSPLLSLVSDSAKMRVYLLSPREAATGNDAIPQIGALKEPTWAAVDQNGELAAPLFGVAEKKAIKKIVDNLEKICRYGNVLELENPDPDEQLTGLIDFVIKRQTSDGRWVIAKPDLIGTGLEFEEGDRVAFNITNRHSEPLYLTLFDLGLTGAITQLYPPKGSDGAIAAGAAFTFGERDELTPLHLPDNFPFARDPNGAEWVAGTEHLKLFITSHPTDLDRLEQLALRGERGSQEEEKRGQTSPIERLLQLARTGHGTRDIAIGVKLPPEERWATITHTFSLRRKSPEIRLNGDESEVVVGDCTLRAPGLRGVVHAHRSNSDRTRSIELSTDRLENVLGSENFTVKQSIEIVDAEEIGSARSATSLGEAAIELKTPAPGHGLEQAILYADESGVIRWSYSPDETHESHFRTYRLRRQVAPSGRSNTRGLFGAVGRKLLKVIVFPLVDPVIGHVSETFARRWEEHKRPYRLRTFTPENYRVKDIDEWNDAKWSELAKGRSLLMIHGTFSRAHTAFGEMAAESVARLHEEYDGRVFAFDHFTLSDDPRANVQWLMKQIPPEIRLKLDIVCHSRGGLVSRVLAEKLPKVGSAKDRLQVGKVVFVATPNAGTELANQENYAEFLDSITNMINFLPDNGATDALEGVLTILRQVVVGAFGGLNGLQSMFPGGEFQNWLNKGPRTKSQYFALASNFAPSDPGWRDFAKHRLLHGIFREQNDLVVPTAGVFAANGSEMFPIEDCHRFEQQDQVTHGNFFGNRIVQDRILGWLASG